MPGGFDAIKPAGYAEAVTPSDTVNLSQETRAVYVGGAGAVACVMVNPFNQKEVNVTFAAVPVGTTLSISTKRILATGTTATNILALS